MLSLMLSSIRPLLRLLPLSALCFCVLLLFGLSASRCAAATDYFVSPSGSDTQPGYAAAPFQTIQHAINMASSGDTILVGDGTYTGPGNVDLDFGGKNLTLQSLNGAASTIINCQGTSSANHRGIYLHSGETRVIIYGFTIQNGYIGGGGSSTDAANGGAGIFSLNVGVTIEYCLFKNNTAVYGGGLYNHNVDTGTVTVINCDFSGNSASYGGAVYDLNESGGKISVTRSTVTNNLAFVSGGGIYNSDNTGGTLAFSACTVSGNMSLGNSVSGIPDGGAGIYTNEYGGSTRVANCVLTGNSAASHGFGGGLYNHAAGGTILVTGCTLTSNKSASGSGGGVNNALDSGTITLTNDIIYGDTGGDVAGSFVNATYCDIQGGYAGTGNINATPLFVTSPSNLHLQSGSPCLGAGTATGTPASTIDGRVRPNPPSIGAYELAAAPIVTTTTLISTLNPSVAGQYIVFQATVAGTGATPTGTVVFTIDGVAHLPVALHSGHYASYISSSLTAGTHMIIAAYSGDTDFASSTSAPLTQTVLEHVNPQYVSPTGSDSNLGTITAPKLTIQAAINATIDGDTVIVEDGTYTGPGNVDIDFVGLNITVVSQNGPATTIIDCQGIANHRCFYLHFGEISTVIRGLTLQNGNDGSGGAGIYNSNAKLTIQNCIIKNNTAYGTNAGGIYNGGTLVVISCLLTGNAAVTNGSTSAGGGIYNDSGTLTVTNCMFSGNSAGEGGGGLYNGTAYNGAAGAGLLTLVNCVFVGNSVSDGSGGGLYNAAYFGANTVTNCTFTGNSASYGYGGGVLSYIGGGGGSTFSLINDIVYGNSGGDISGTFSIVNHCDIPGGYSGVGSIDADPLFANSPTDLHLQSGSPCLGAGTASGAPTTTIDGQARPNPPSIGAYELAATPRPTLTSLSPSSAYAGGGSLTLTVNGTNFVSGARVKFGSTSLATTFVSGTQLTATITSTLRATVGAYTIKVYNPGSISSNGKTFTLKPRLTALTLSASRVSGGQTVTGTVTLNGPAPNGGVTIPLTSSNTTRATVPASVTVAAGATSATFPIMTLAVTTTGSTILTANGAGGTLTATLTVLAPVTPTADTFGQDGSTASTNYGTTNPLLIKTATSPGTNRDSYLQFSLGGFTTVTSAKLVVTAYLSGSGSLTTGVYGTSSAWTESGLTWNSKPPLGSSLGSFTATTTTNITYTVDVTAYVQSQLASGTVSFGLHNPSASTLVTRLVSREGGSGAAQLIITGN